MLRPFHILVACLVLLPTSGWPREAARIAPLAPVSGPSPFAGCTLDGVPFQFGINYPNSEVEPWIDVDPTDPMHLAATWQQDRWSNGGSRGNVVAISFDGGLTWQSSTLPQLTRCTGGPFLRASDPWLSFAPNGDLYHISLAFTGGSTNAMLVHRSADGGLTWDNPKTIVSNLSPLFNDKEAITADPNNPRFVYAVWDRLNFANGTGPTLFARTANRGLTWGPARVIHNPGFNAQTVANQIVVQPDGTVYNFFSEIFNFPFGSIFLSFKTSETMAAHGSRPAPRSGRSACNR